MKWVLALFGLPFVAAGAFAMYQAYENVLSAHPSLIALLMFWPIGVIFFSAGSVMVLVGCVGKEVKPGEESRLAQRKRQLGIQTPQEAWRMGRIQSRGASIVFGGWFRFAVSLVLLAPVLWIGYSHAILRELSEYRFWCGFILIPFWYLAKAVYKTLRFRKYGASVCDIQRRPSASNSELQILIRNEKTPLPAGDATVRLRVEKRETIGSGEDSRQKITVLWNESQNVMVQSMGLGIPVTYNIPSELPEASNSNCDGIFWILEAKIAAPGVDYHAIFDLALERKE